MSLPPTAKSLTYTTQSSNPRVIETPLAPPSPKELVVKVHAAAINPVDTQIWRSGLIGWLAGKKEKGIGRDYSGTVVAVGKEVEALGKWRVGDEVFGLLVKFVGEGTFSQYIHVSPATDPIAKKPTCFTYEMAAAVPLVVLTAFACLDWLPREKAEDGMRRIIVAGASGGVGIWCVQLAKKLYNCHVTGICSAKNANFVRQIGADEIVDYTSQFVAQTLLEEKPSGRKYDLYIDCVGGTDMFEYIHDLLHPNAAYITIVGDKTSRELVGGPITYSTYPAQIIRYAKGLIWGPRYANISLYKKSELLQQVAALAERGEVEVIVQEVVEGVLDEGSEKWKEVFDLIDSAKVRGKIVVKIA
ncbi:NAD(P)-binding protein [Glonium stellatum]|uniref:NAD(P)-binding protein n=1 Tax=Glonium stellatum TaxID=574774 RepID=A0A8E2JPX8_9PEZI|nr:NAD(P)-binding protein [Glonium stellatum]